MRAEGFAPVARPDARVLVLGSLPGRRSIDAGEYYAHPRNAFWRIVEDLFDISRELAYRDRTDALARCRVALWDVLRASRRPGSLDAAIETEGAEPNEFAAFFAAHPEIRLVCFNGRKAEELFRRVVVPKPGSRWPESRLLPSTSPAHAAMSYAEKLRHWSIVLASACPGGAAGR